jgi:hypothetical protein
MIACFAERETLTKLMDELATQRSANSAFSVLLPVLLKMSKRRLIRDAASVGGGGPIFY